MAEIRPGIRTHGAILADNVAGYVNYAIDQRGMRRERIIRVLQQRYPDAPRDEIAAAYQHVIASRASGRRLTSAAAEQGIPDEQYPERRGIPSGYAYVVRIIIPRGAGEPDETFHSFVYSDRPLSRSEVEAEAYAYAHSRIEASGRRTNRYPGDLPNADQVQYQIMTAERLT